MRKMLMMGAAALLLAGCGGEEYPVPVGQAYTTLTSVGTPSGFYPLPAGLQDIDVRFEAVPADNAVQWLFSHDGESLARIVASVSPSGDAASKVSVDYVEGPAPDENWRNGKVKQMIKTSIHQLAVEAVDSKFENRPFDEALRDRIEIATVTTSVGDMMTDASEAMKVSDEQRARWRESDARVQQMQDKIRTDPARATRPALDLSKQ